MKTLTDKLKDVEKTFKILKKRLKDNTLLESQKLIDNVKLLIDNEINRRMFNVNKDSNLRGSNK